MLKAKIISSLDKVFLDSSFNEFTALTGISAFLNQRVSVQLLTTDFDVSAPHRRFLPLSVEGIDPAAVSFRSRASSSLCSFSLIRLPPLSSVSGAGTR